MRAALRWLGVALFVMATLAVAGTQYQPSSEMLYENGTHRFPEGIAIGDMGAVVPGIGCMGWSEVDDCFYIDSNCDYVKDLTERTLCDCECCAEGTTTSTTVATTTSVTTTTLAGTTTSTAATTTSTVATTTSTSSTTSTTIEGAFAEGACHTVVGLRGEHDELFPWIAPTAQEVIGVGCHCEGQCVAPIATIELIDNDGDTISTTGALACSTLDAATTFVAINGADSDRLLAEGDRYGYRVTNSPNSYDRMTVCVQF